MQSTIANRITELALKWQTSDCWLSGFEMVARWHDQEHAAHRASQRADMGYPIEQRELAEAHSINATRARDVVNDRRAELAELENLLRDHAPRLLQLIPIVDFYSDSSPPPDKLKDWQQAMRTIEAEVLTDATTPPSGKPIATVEEQSLAVLVSHPDWTVKRIAAEVGTNAKYLSSKNCQRFKAARAAIRACNIPQGTKTKTGSLEAAGDDELDFDAMDERMTTGNKR